MKTPAIPLQASASRTAISGAASVTALIGLGGPGPADKPTRVQSLKDFDTAFAGRAATDDLRRAVTLFFANGGTAAWIVAASALPGAAATRTGLYALDTVAGLSLLALPGLSDPAFQAAAVAYAEGRDAFVILDAPSSLTTRAAAEAWLATASALRRPNAAAYLSLLTAQGGSQPVASSGAVVGVMLRLEAARGIWKAASGLDAKVAGASGPPAGMAQTDLDALALEGLNSLRRQPTGDVVVWGARTFVDPAASGADWKYVPVRRLALFVRQSLRQGLAWTGVQPNAAPLWAAAQQDVQAFLFGLFQRGAFQGSTPQRAFFARCDGTTMTQNDLDNGRLVIEVGIAPLRPAEFVILQIELATADSPGRAAPP